MRVVLDTNVWLSAFLTKSPTSAARFIWDSWRAGLFQVMVSHAIVNEVTDKLFELGFERNDVEEFSVLLYGLARIVTIKHQVMGCRDPKDDPFIETAINGKAECLVTRDKRLLKLPRHVATYVKAHGVAIMRDVRREADEPDFCTLLRSRIEIP